MKMKQKREYSCANSNSIDLMSFAGGTNGGAHEKVGWARHGAKAGWGCHMTAKAIRIVKHLHCHDGKRPSSPGYSGLAMYSSPFGSAHTKRKYK